MKSKLKKGTRVICRIAKNEWYTGTVQKVDEKVEVVFDDGFRTVAEDDELHFIKRMRQNCVSLQPLNLEMARALYLSAPLNVVSYDEKNESNFKTDLSASDRPWLELLHGLRNVTTLTPFNELLLLDFRSPIHEYSLGMLSKKVDKLNAQDIEKLLHTAASSVIRFAKACNLVAQCSEDNSRIAISNATSRQTLRIKLGAFKGGRAYIQVAPI